MPATRSGIEIANLDREVRPQDDLFRYVNGTWLATAEIPADRALQATFNMLADEAEAGLRELIEEAAASDAEAGTPARKVGDLYASFCDTDRVDALGVSPLAADLAAIAAVRDVRGLLELSGRLQREGTGGAVGLFVDTDARDSSRYLPYLQQSGLGLPDESYYREDSFAPVREQYVAHVGRMLVLAGVASEDDAAGHAERVMALETTLAAGHWDRVRCRDALATYNNMDRDKLSELSPGVDWSAWLAGAQAPESTLDEVVVRQPSFVEAWARALVEVPLDDWKVWLSWHLVHSAAPYLSSDVVTENFDFYGRTLTGAEEQRDRWKRGVALVERAMGEAAGQLYVERYFPPRAKERMLELVGNLIAAYRASITELDWMTDETKQRALEKLARFTPKIGYPDSWRDYGSLTIDRDDLLGNVRAADAFETDRELAKLGSPVDRDEWFMTPQTVNAYYNPGMNEIVFPAAILRPPFFDADADDAANYGGIGAVIGHEIGHGFDDQGSKYDGDGNLDDWWTEEDRSAFDERTQALIAQYSALAPKDLPDGQVNGALTVGENIGDLGGVAIAYRAYVMSLGGDVDAAPVLDDMTGAQRFFAGWAQCWRALVREAEAIRRLSVDPHSPPELRANVVRNLEEFYAAFDVNKGDGLWLEPEERVRIW
ncbi:MAG TPA: M13-type metalloendopeptidase [Actinomycetales bacterium]|nr:M13-type metalloendopeptidase [Actinomycetales bacterium]